VMPSLFESDSSPIYEAWLEGTPIVCSNVTSLPVQVMDAAILFDPYDPESIANAMRRVATDSSLRHDLTAYGYLRVKDYDWNRTAKAYRAVYRRAAGHLLSEEDRWLLEWDWMERPMRLVGARA
jgi:glycosyltransferase involved in cell wall biosynthesis